MYFNRSLYLTFLMLPRQLTRAMEPFECDFAFLQINKKGGWGRGLGVGMIGVITMYCITKSQIFTQQTTFCNIFLFFSQKNALPFHANCMKD